MRHVLVNVLLWAAMTGGSAAEEPKIETVPCLYHRVYHLGLKEMFDLMSKPDSACSPYDTEEFKEQLIEQMMEGFGRDASDGYYFTDRDFRDVYFARLIDVYEFEEDADFLLLVYSIDRRPGQGFVSPSDALRIDAGYVVSSKKLYLLRKGFGRTIEERFNLILEENDGTPTLLPVCKAVLMTRLMYRGGMLAIVDTWCDSKVWIKAYSKLLPDDLPKEWLGTNALFPFYPSIDSVLLSALEMTIDDPCKNVQLNPYMDEIVAEAKDSVQLSPLSVSRCGDTTFVQLTTHHVTGSDGEIATWEVAISVAGFVLFVRRGDVYQYGPRVIF